MSTPASDGEAPTTTRRKGVIDTRRAEQNRAAQRAFRQRKERYVKELEGKVRDMQGLQERVNKLEQENERLRQRIWELEHRPSPPLSNTTAGHAAQPPPPPPSTYYLSHPPSYAHPAPRLPPAPSNQSSRPPRLTDQIPPTQPPQPVDEDEEEKIPKPENGRVLDDLVTMLRSRHRPPIPAHLQEPPSSSSSPSMEV